MYSVESRTEYDQIHTEEELQDFKLDVLDGNFENDPGFGYFGDLDGQVFATFPFSLDATHEDDPYWLAAWTTLLRSLKEAEGVEVKDETLEDDTGAIRIESYKLWVGSIRVKTVRFDTGNEAVLRRALTLYENMEGRGSPYGLADEDTVYQEEDRLLQEAWDDEFYGLADMVEEYVRSKHFGWLYRNNLTPRKFTENYGQRLAENGMRDYGSWGYLDEDMLDSGWRDIEYDIEHGYI
jgi:hypothetical protein